jgi:surface carbohydrate biosynthesis protein
MILYIPLEIKVRELQGHLLLASEFVSRGHQVVIANNNELWLLFRLGFLKKGCYLLKNMNVPSSSQNDYEKLIKRGFDLYCHEQEPSILWGDFNNYLKSSNIHHGQSLPFKAVFCYGDRDTNEFKKIFIEKKEIFHKTGSPRIDYWGKKFGSVHKNNNKTNLTDYVLIVSNFPFLMGQNHMSEYYLIKSELEQLETYENEKYFFNFLKEDIAICIHIIIAVKNLSLKYPEKIFVIRPHPIDCIEYWKNIFKKNNNVIISGNTEPLTPMISQASVVIQNGCTSALETVIQSVPLITYGPDRLNGDLNVPNKLGIRAKNLDELVAVLDNISMDEYHKNIQIDSQEVLKPLVYLDGSASIRISEIIEKNSNFQESDKLRGFDFIIIKFIINLKKFYDLIRNLLSLRFHELPINSLSEHEIKNEISIISNVQKIPIPRFKIIDKTFLVLRR